jgi:hypothetical protein
MLGLAHCRFKEAQQTTDSFGYAKLDNLHTQLDYPRLDVAVIQAIGSA